jgi:hypothetical protein
MTTLATLESRINGLSRRQQRGIEYSGEEGSRQAAGNEPPAIQIYPKSSRASLWALLDRFFIPSGRLCGQVNGPRALPAPTRISPAPATEQKQHYNND